MLDARWSEALKTPRSPEFRDETMAASRWYPVRVRAGSRDSQVGDGKYDIVADRFKDNLSVALHGVDVGRITTKESVNAVMVTSRKRRNMLQIIKEAEHIGLFPAQIEHLLAFGAKYPMEQRRGPIVAFGSQIAVNGLWHVPCLDSVVQERRIWYTPWSMVKERKRRLTTMPRQLLPSSGKKTPVLWPEKIRILFVDY